MIEIKTTLTLRCERCKATFLYVADLEAGEPRGTSADIEIQALAAVDRIIDTAQELRVLAQQAGWTEILPGRGPLSQRLGRDLCPNCFCLPPEG